MNGKRVLASLALGLWLTLALLCLLGAGLPPARADTLCVNPDGSGGCYPSIQAALDAADDGDVIRVAQGTYSETLVITRSVTLQGGWNAGFTARDWDLYPTTIDARRMGPVIWVSDPVSPTVEGFVITGGDDSGYAGWGGGIKVDYGPLDEGTTTVRYNVITNNVACHGSCQGYGGGIMLYYGSAVIEHNTIISNAARTGGAGGGRGGGVGVRGFGATVILSGNVIVSNTAVFSTSGPSSGQGGGVYLDSIGGATLRDNEIRGNVAAVEGSGYGGGVYATRDLYDNRILNNTASVTGTGYGGGVYAYGVQNFHDNLVQGNVAAPGGDGSGGGVYALQLQWARRNTIVDNQAARGGGLYLSPGSGTELRDNLVARNRADGAGSTTDGGGGVVSAGDDVTIIGNAIVSNTAAYFGGGLLLADSRASQVRDNTFERNTATYGGGVFVYSSTGVIARNWIVDNVASNRGGGVQLYASAAPTMDANHILSNTVTAGEGGGVCVRNNHVPVTLTNHVIAHNGAAGAGAGVYLSLSSDVYLVNNTLVDNDWHGGQEGVALFDGSQVTMTNNVVVGHSVAVTVATGSTATLSHNDYWDNTVSVGGQPSGATDLTLDPQFEGRASGDYHLHLTSPVVDAGDSSVNVPFDFEGDPRPRGGGIDIGADEAYRAESYVSQLVGSDTTGTGAADGPFASVTRGISETRTGGTVYVARGHYTGVITIGRSVSLRGGYSETGWLRNVAAYTTTLDGQGMGTVVTVRGEDVQALVEGFTVTGGAVGAPLGRGGGLAVYDGAAATIRYNVITGNRAQNAGGGLAVEGNGTSESVIAANYIHDNVAEGISPWLPAGVALPSTPRQGGPEPGGGLLVLGGPARVVNNFVYSNTSPVGGDGLAVWGESEAIYVYHNTVVDNGGAGSVGVEVRGPASEIYLYDNLIVGHGVGISATAGTQVTWDYNGFDGNDADYAPGLSAGAHDVSGDPYFVDRPGGDLHIDPASEMANRGRDVGVLSDVDGGPRPEPAGSPPDLGADEVSYRVYLPLVLCDW